MTVDLEALPAFLKLCRKQGVAEIAFGSISVKFGELPRKSGKTSADDSDVPGDGLTEEQLMFYSAGGET